MSPKFYILTWTAEFKNSDSGKIAGQPRYYQYVEDANYKAGKLLEQFVTEKLADVHDVWGNIGKCGGTPLGKVDYTVTVREERLYDDLQDLVPVPLLNIGSGSVDLSGSGT